MSANLVRSPCDRTRFEQGEFLLGRQYPHHGHSMLPVGTDNTSAAIGWITLQWSFKNNLLMLERGKCKRDRKLSFHVLSCLTFHAQSGARLGPAGSALPHYS